MDEVKTIQEILSLFDRHQLAELKLESADFKLSLKSGKYAADEKMSAAPAPAPMAWPMFPGGFPYAAAPLPQGVPQTAPAVTAEEKPAAPADDALARADFAAAVEEAFEAGDLAMQQKLAEQAGWTAVKSPMMGTFYAASKPGADPYATKGSSKKKGEVLCIIEAMKMMNELPAPADCEIRQVAVKDGQIIEYGQVLFWISRS